VNRAKQEALLCGAGNSVTSCDLRVFVDEAAESVPAQNAHTGHVARTGVLAIRTRAAASTSSNAP
jgi:hypothetical protein